MKTSFVFILILPLLMIAQALPTPGYEAELVTAQALPTPGYEAELVTAQNVPIPVYEAELVTAQTLPGTEDDTELIPGGTHGDRHRRVTCDLLSIGTPWGSLNHAACAAHCIFMNKGYSGGRCINGVCNCRR